MDEQQTPSQQSPVSSAPTHTTQLLASTIHFRRQSWALRLIVLIIIAFMIITIIAEQQTLRLISTLGSSNQMITNLQQQETARLIELSQKTHDLQQTITTQNQKLSLQQSMLEQNSHLQLNSAALYEVKTLIASAEQQLQFNKNIPLTIQLLVAADQRLQDSTSENLPLRTAIATDLANLRRIEVIDITGEYLKLAAIEPKLEQLALPPSSNPPMPTKGLATHSSWQSALQALQQMVIIRYHPLNTIPFVLPETKYYLIQNLHTQLQTALWALLHQQDAIYHRALTQAEIWIKKYFLADAYATMILKTLNRAQQLKLDIETPTLQAVSIALSDSTPHTPSSES